VAHRAPAPTGFYDNALSRAEAELVAAARQVSGLDQEIAVLRLKLRSLLADQPDQLDRVAQLVDLLIRAVTTRYRFTTDQQSSMLDALADVLGSVSGALGPTLETLLRRPQQP